MDYNNKKQVIIKAFWQRICQRVSRENYPTYCLQVYKKKKKFIINSNQENHVNF